MTEENEKQAKAFFKQHYTVDTLVLRDAEDPSKYKCFIELQGKDPISYYLPIAIEYDSFTGASKVTPEDCKDFAMFLITSLLRHSADATEHMSNILDKMQEGKSFQQSAAEATHERHCKEGHGLDLDALLRGAEQDPDDPVSH